MKIMYDKCAYKVNRAHSTDAGIDIRSSESSYVMACGSHVFHTGVHVELPHGTAGLLVSKSGLNTKHGITSTGLIDDGYTGEIMVKLYNNSDSDYFVRAGDKISQLVVIPVLYEDVEEVEHLTEGTERGANGFGSTGA